MTPTLLFAMTHGAPLRRGVVSLLRSAFSAIPGLFRVNGNPKTRTRRPDGPSSLSARIVSLIDAGIPNLLVVGPAGCGKTPCAVNAALANGHIPTPDGPIARHPDTVVIATTNTWGTGADRQYCGSNQLDAAPLPSPSPSQQQHRT